MLQKFTSIIRSLPVAVALLVAGASTLGAEFLTPSVYVEEIPGLSQPAWDPADSWPVANYSFGVRLENRGDDSLRAGFVVKVVVNNDIVEFPQASIFLSPKSTTIHKLSIPGLSALAAKLRFSGKIDVDVLVTNTGNSANTGGGLDILIGRTDRDIRSATVKLPQLFFHPQGRGVLVYDGKILRKQFGAGNFRREPIDSSRAEKEMTDAIRYIGPNFGPVLGRIHTGGSYAGPSQGNPADNARFCFVIDGDAYNDSSKRQWNNFNTDYGEDFGRGDSIVPMARGWVSVGQNGAPLYSGFLDSFGCTPYLAASQNSEVVVAFFPIYLKQADNIRGVVSDLNAAQADSNSVPYFLFFVQPQGPLTITMLDKTEYAYTIFGAAAACLERFPGGLTNALYEFQLRQIGDNSGTLTNYAPEGHPIIYIKYSTTAQSKFTIAHEYGHAVLIQSLNPQLTPADLDYSVEAGEANQHTLTSKEWQLAAAIEGFAHFVSGVVWNEVGTDEDAVFVVGSDPNPYLNSAIQLNEYSKVFETNFNAANYPHQGVEKDWAQFFWNYVTDSSAIAGVQAPSPENVLSMFLASYPWPVHEGFFADFQGGASAVLPATAPVATPLASKMLRFNLMAIAAGIAH